MEVPLRTIPMRTAPPQTRNPTTKDEREKEPGDRDAGEAQLILLGLTVGYYGGKIIYKTTWKLGELVYQGGEKFYQGGEYLYDLAEAKLDEKNLEKRKAIAEYQKHVAEERRLIKIYLVYLQHVHSGGDPDAPMHMWVDEFGCRPIRQSDRTEALVLAHAQGLADGRAQGLPDGRPQGLSDGRTLALGVLQIGSCGIGISNMVELKRSRRIPEQVAQCPEGRATENENIVKFDKWLVNMLKCNALLNNRRVNDPRIPIAIFDSGIDMTHPRVRNRPWGSVKGLKSFMGTRSWNPFAGHGISDEFRSSDEEVQDNDGHGTHLFGLLQTVAPSANIYIGKVCENQGSKLASKNLAFAIRFAVEKWKVHVISLSVGYPDQEPEEVRDAINFALSKDVLVFAAAGNSKTSPMAFPARMANVIPIFSYGAKGPSCNNPRPTPTDYICAPGEDVKSIIPLDCIERLSRTRQRDIAAEGREVAKSGSSQATAIASGVAACVLEFVRQYVRERQHEIDRGIDVRAWPDLSTRLSILRKPHGMMRVLKMLCSNKSGPMLLEPWHIMTLSEDVVGSRLTLAGNVLQALQLDQTL